MCIKARVQKMLIDTFKYNLYFIIFPQKFWGKMFLRTYITILIYADKSDAGHRFFLFCIKSMYMGPTI